MIAREFDINQFSSDTALASEIRSIVDREEILVLRKGRSKFDRFGWRDFLLNECGMEVDQRQYNFNGELELVDWWEISYQPDKATAYTYSNTRQPLHCDNAWFADPAEMNFFIMEKQSTSGGEQTFYRLSRLLEDLEREAPELLRDLTTIEVTVKKGQDFKNTTPIIRLDPQPRIFWNFYRTEKQDPAIARMCDAFFEFLEHKEATPSVERMRAMTGDCFCWHDQKMLHGRGAFAAEKPFDRIVYQAMWRTGTDSPARA